MKIEEMVDHPMPRLHPLVQLSVLHEDGARRDLSLCIYSVSFYEYYDER